jgi:hypothetical protein
MANDPQDTHDRLRALMVVQLLPAPAGWKVVTKGRDKDTHEPLAAIGLARGGDIIPISPSFSGDDPISNRAFCIERQMYDASGVRPCPVCSRP